MADADLALLNHSKLVSQQIAIASEYAIFTGNISSLKQDVKSALMHPKVVAKEAGRNIVKVYKKSTEKAQSM